MPDIIRGMIGFNPSDITWEDMDVIAEVKTNSEDSNGYPFSETIGCAKNQYGDMCLFRGSIQDIGNDQCNTLIFSQDGNNLSVVLRELADKIEEQQSNAS